MLQVKKKDGVKADSEPALWFADLAFAAGLLIF